MSRFELLSRFPYFWLPVMLLALVRPAWPGGGPETTLLVVNADSILSLTVANEYIRLRDLPERQVLWLKDVPVGETITIDVFRRRILNPIREYLGDSGLDDEIDLITYSAGFPYGVDFSQDLERSGRKHDKRAGTVASLTGLTYFMHRVAVMDTDYLHPRANQYFRPPRLDPEGGGAGFAASGGFRSRHAWKQGNAQAAGSLYDRYYLSVMLGYSGVRGNSLPEILNYLGRAAGADGTRPDGTVYLMVNRNIRSRVRQPLFPATLKALQERGRAVEVIAQGQRGQDGRIPRNRTDIIGLVAGTRVFDWEASGSRMLPGAIAESFTSYGGHFSHGVQTKLTEFLRHGAAGSSGAVREPYSFVEKFPLPQLHRYYADGSSLAEAFYQSVSSPYQLIVVGDPLTRPFARFATLELAAPDPAQPWQGRVHIEPQVRMPPGEKLERVELWVDGLPAGKARPGEPLELDTRSLAGGFHELRLVAVAAGPMETRSYRSWSFTVSRHDLELGLQADRQALPYGADLQLSGQATGATSVRLYQGRRLLADAVPTDGRWQAAVPTTLLGEGRVELHAEANYPGGAMTRSAPLELRILPPATVPGQQARPAGRGVMASVRQDDDRESRLTLDGLSGGRGPGDWRRLRALNTVYTGLFESRVAGLYELCLEVEGRLTVLIDGETRFDDKLSADPGGARIPLELGSGWHHFEISIQTEAPSQFPRATMSGPEPPFLLEGDRVSH